MNLPHAYRLSVKCHGHQSIREVIHPHAIGQNQVRLALAQHATRLLSKPKPLLLGLGPGRSQPQPHRWHLSSHGRGIRPSFHFDTFNNTWIRANQPGHDYCNG